MANKPLKRLEPQVPYYQALQADALHQWNSALAGNNSATELALQAETTLPFWNLDQYFQVNGEAGIVRQSGHSYRYGLLAHFGEDALSPSYFPISANNTSRKSRLGTIELGFVQAVGDVAHESILRRFMSQHPLWGKIAADLTSTRAQLRADLATLNTLLSGALKTIQTSKAQYDTDLNTKKTEDERKKFEAQYETIMQAVWNAQFNNLRKEDTKTLVAQVAGNIERNNALLALASALQGFGQRNNFDTYKVDGSKITQLVVLQFDDTKQAADYASFLASYHSTGPTVLNGGDPAVLKAGENAQHFGKMVGIRNMTEQIARELGITQSSNALASIRNQTGVKLPSDLDQHHIFTAPNTIELGNVGEIKKITAFVQELAKADKKLSPLVEERATQNREEWGVSVRALANASPHPQIAFPGENLAAFEGSWQFEGMAPTVLKFAAELVQPSNLKRNNQLPEADTNFALSFLAQQAYRTGDSKFAPALALRHNFQTNHGIQNPNFLAGGALVYDHVFPKALPIPHNLRLAAGIYRSFENGNGLGNETGLNLDAEFMFKPEENTTLRTSASYHALRNDDDNTFVDEDRTILAPGEASVTTEQPYLPGGQGAELRVSSEYSFRNVWGMSPHLDLAAGLDAGAQYLNDVAGNPERGLGFFIGLHLRAQLGVSDE